MEKQEMITLSMMEVVTVFPVKVSKMLFYVFILNPNTSASDSII